MVLLDYSPLLYPHEFPNFSRYTLRNNQAPSCVPIHATHLRTGRGVLTCGVSWSGRCFDYFVPLHKDAMGTQRPHTQQNPKYL